MAYKNSQYVDKAFLASENESLMASHKILVHLLRRVLYMHSMKNTLGAMTDEDVNKLMAEIRAQISK